MESVFEVESAFKAGRLEDGSTEEFACSAVLELQLAKATKIKSVMKALMRRIRCGFEWKV